MAKQIDDQARAHGIRIGCFRPPSVPDGVSRLRITTSAGVAPDAWERALEIVVKVVETNR